MNDLDGLLVIAHQAVDLARDLATSQPIGKLTGRVPAAPVSPGSESNGRVLPDQP